MGVSINCGSFFVGVLSGPHYLGSIPGPLIFGNPHFGLGFRLLAGSVGMAATGGRNATSDATSNLLPVITSPNPAQFESNIVEKR